MKLPAVALPVILVTVFALGACGGTPLAPTPTPPSAPTPAASATVAPVSFPRTDLRTPNRTISVEVATTPEQSERGLGYRDVLAADAGMLFDLGSERAAVFWMKGMRFALDFVWIDAARRVTQITPDVPPQPGVPDGQLVRYSPAAPVRYVLELNAGAAARLQIKAGDELDFTLP